MKNKNIKISLISISLLLFNWFSVSVSAAPPTVENPQNGSIGVQGTISAAPPSIAPSISSPSNGQTFTSLPVRVSGICTTDLLIKVFKNNVFGGSVVCKNGSYSIDIDLFSGSNELIARVYDDLDQAGPDSNIVNVTFNDNRSVNVGPRVSITSNYAKRGANPGATLGWPLSITGGTGPYAISIDWGDGKSDLISRDFTGTISPEHIYDAAGVYNVIAKVTDKDGITAYLQLVSIVNGVPGTDANGKSIPGSQPNNTNNSNTNTATNTTRLQLVVWPFYILVPFIASTFWLGKRHALYVIRKKLQKGEHPFHK